MHTLTKQVDEIFQAYTLRFEPGADGSCAGVEVQAGGEPASFYIRMPQVTPDERSAAVYLGSYVSPELDVKYEVVLEDGELGLRRRKYGFTPLRPTVPDGFSTPDFDVLFRREPGGAVTELLVTNGRVRNLKFSRV